MRATLLWTGAAALVAVAGWMAFSATQSTPTAPAWRVARLRQSSAVFVAPNGRAYQYVAAPKLSWQAAREAAQALTWHGRHGDLATIDSQADYDFIIHHVFSRGYGDVTYLGGRQTAPGQWRWVTGPDARADGGKGRLFWKGDEQGQAVNGAYANWMASAFQHGGAWDVNKVCCVTLFSYGLPQFSTSLGTGGDNQEGVAGYLVAYGD